MFRERLNAFCRRRLRSLITSIVFGAVIATIFTIGREHTLIDRLATAAIGSVVGIAIWINIAILEILFQPAIDRLDERRRQTAHGFIFLIAGLNGWVTGIYIANWILGPSVTIASLVTGAGLPFMLMTGGIVVVVGLVFRTIELMRDRLSESMRLLQETEWAQKELELARSIQTRLLPPQTIEGNGFSIAARNFPAHLVAGDFYDVVQLDDGSIIVVVADVAGKGMGASLIMASVKAVLPFVARSTVGEAIATLNEKLVHELDRREFVALAYARFFPADGTLQLANAGFPDPYLIRGVSVQPLSVAGVRLPLGIRAGVRHQTLTTTLQPRDRIVFVSDGIPEAPVGGTDQLLGYDRLADALRVGVHDQADPWLEELLARIRSEVSEPLQDDWTALVLQFTAGARAAA